MTVPASLTFDVNGTPQTITLPQSGDTGQRSVFVISLPKAGSTLMNNLMEPLCAAAGLAPFSLPQVFRQLGLKPIMYPEDLSPLFKAAGYAYVGFRGWPIRHKVPGFATGRSLFLVRDPRDMLVSLYFSEAFSHGRPGTGADTGLAEAFDQRRQETLQQSIDTFVLQRSKSVQRLYQTTSDKLSALDHRVWRYEDVVFDKAVWVGEMLDYLSLDVPPQIVAETIAQHDVVPETENVNRHIRRVTPGDHRTKLKPETIDALNGIFAGVMSRYDYT